MIEVNVVNVVTIAIISLAAVALIKGALNATGKSQWASYV